MSLIDLFSQHCACCNQPGPALCRSCRFALASSPRVVGEHGVQAALPFEGVARSAIVALKYRNRRPVAAHLAKLMVRRLGIGGPGSRHFDVVTWAPTSAARVRERGFDQAELLAREVARSLGVPCRRLLYRTHTGHDSPQTGRDRSQRLGSRGPAFRARPARPGVRVLVIDDVVTTGATLLGAASALRGAGIDHVTMVAAAATPLAVRPPFAAGSAARHLPLQRLRAGAQVGSVPA